MLVYFPIAFSNDGGSCNLSPVFFATLPVSPSKTAQGQQHFTQPQPQQAKYYKMNAGNWLEEVWG